MMKTTEGKDEWDDDHTILIVVMMTMMEKAMDDSTGDFERGYIHSSFDSPSRLGWTCSPSETRCLVVRIASEIRPDTGQESPRMLCRDRNLSASHDRPCPGEHCSREREKEKEREEMKDKKRQEWIGNPTKEGMHQERKKEGKKGKTDLSGFRSRWM